MVGAYQPGWKLNYFGVQGIRGWEDPPILETRPKTKTSTAVNTRSSPIAARSSWSPGTAAKTPMDLQQPAAVANNEQMMGSRVRHLILPKKKNREEGK